MYLFKEKNIKLPKKQNEIAKELGITQGYLSKILNQKTTCRKVIAYAITKMICTEKEISDLFERVEKYEIY